jgi:2,5-diamino-6-(ribosylamino)-4(3H)-pyrimidinone 5'-phosphate reductase
MLPRIIIHNAVSVDGRLDWFKADVERFYELISAWNEDATLAGSETLLQAYKDQNISEDETFSEAQVIDKDDARPILFVPDSRGRIKLWNQLKKEEYWKGVVALISHSTPGSYITYLENHHVDYIIAGNDHVDFREALEQACDKYGITMMRVDSGGTLNGVLLRSGLVDEVSILVHPYLVGGTTPSSFFKAEDLDTVNGVISLKYKSVQKVEGDLLWVKYDVIKEIEKDATEEAPKG